MLEPTSRYIDPLYGANANKGVLSRDVKISNAIFRSGVPIKSVLDAARRAYERWIEADSVMAQPEVMTFEQIEAAHTLLTQEGRKFVPIEAYQNLQRELAYIRQNQVEYPIPTFQQRLVNWVITCFGSQIGRDKAERDFRFYEEATELVQSRGMKKEEAHAMVEATYARPAGKTYQEIGGVVTTLAALCSTEKHPQTGQEVDMMEAGEAELTRIWGQLDLIREKQKTKIHRLTAFQEQCVSDVEKRQIV